MAKAIPLIIVVLFIIARCDQKQAFEQTRSQAVNLHFAADSPTSRES